MRISIGGSFLFLRSRKGGGAYGSDLNMAGKQSTKSKNQSKPKEEIIMSKKRSITKTVNIDGKDVTFRASAAIPRIYRNKFHRDIYKDLHDLQKSIDENDPENSALDSFSLELFEDISYIMAKHADPQGVPDTPDEWLDQFGTFSIYQVLPEIIELWGLNVQTQVESKKNFERLTGK